MDLDSVEIIIASYIHLSGSQTFLNGNEKALCWKLAQVVDDMTIFNRGSIPTDLSSDFLQVLTRFEKECKQHDVGNVTEGARQVIIRTWFIVNVLHARDIFAQRIASGPIECPRERAMLDHCSDIFEQGAMRESLKRQSPQFTAWCENMYEKTFALLYYEQVEVTPKFFERTWLEQECKDLFEQHKWGDFARRHGLQDDAATEPSVGTQAEFPNNSATSLSLQMGQMSFTGCNDLKRPFGTDLESWETAASKRMRFSTPHTILSGTAEEEFSVLNPKV
jgi:hypothetical protein